MGGKVWALLSGTLKLMLLAEFAEEQK